MTIFEVEEDLKREQVAIKKFVDIFGGSFQKLDQKFFMPRMLKV